MFYLLSSTESHILPTKFDKDDKWHHFCVVRDSNSGETITFVDGVNTYENHNTEFMLPRRVPLAGGKMFFGGSGFYQNSGLAISDFNIWDRILTDDEIAKMAQSCDGGNRGNVKDWSDMKNELTLSKYKLTTPSKCKKSEQ